MPEFIRQPQQSQLAALIGQMEARRADPLAQGILQAAQGIGGGIAARGERRAAGAEAERRRLAQVGAGREAGIMELLGRGGTFAGPAGAPVGIAQLLPGLGLPAGTTFTAPRERESITITPEILVNYPQIAKMGYATGDMVPSSVFVAQTRELKAEKAPAGFRFRENGSLEPIAGGPAELKIKESEEKSRNAQEAVRTHASDVVDAAGKAISTIGPKTTGVVGSVLSGVPGSERKALEGYIDTLKASLAFERLQEMRTNSKTGGALGNVSDNELRLLSSSVAALDPNQPSKVLKENIAKVRAKYEGILEKLETPVSGIVKKPADRKKISPLDSLIEKHLGGP